MSFVYTTAVAPPRFVGRRDALRRVLEGIVAVGGTSTLVVSELPSGKTSFLEQVAAELTSVESARRRPVIARLDVSLLSAGAGPGDFWHALADGSPDAAAYLPPRDSACRRLRSESSRLVLVLDNVDAALKLQSLANTAFLNGLRNLAQAADPVLALVASSRVDRTALDHEARRIAGFASPFFNHLEEMHLGPLDKRELATLLDGLGRDDARFISELSGGNPWMAQLLGASLDAAAYRGRARRRVAARDAVLRASTAFEACWAGWVGGTRALLVGRTLEAIIPVAPASGGEPPGPLSRLLGRTCSGPEARRLAALIDSCLPAALPGPEAAEIDVLHALALEAARRGLVGPLLRELVAERPHRAEEIRAEAGRMGVWLPPATLLARPDGLEARGILDDRGAVRPGLMVAWLWERLAPVARGEVAAAVWLEANALPSSRARDLEIALHSSPQAIYGARGWIDGAVR